VANDSRSDDWSAILAAHKELGDEYDQVFVEAVVERLTTEVDERVDARVAELGAGLRASRRRSGSGVLVYSLAIGIPISAVAGNYGHVAGLAVAWGGIVLVNLANAWRSREVPPLVRRGFAVPVDLSGTRNRRLR
jgi:hypothetical protein